MGRKLKTDINTITTTQIQWIVQTLNHYVGCIKQEMDSSSDGSPICAIGEVVMDGRTNLVNRLNDIVDAGYKTIKII